jgi:pimeloyl-ACP methyl ester carboxylesterase
MKQLQALGSLGSIAVATLLSTFCATAVARSSVAGEPAVCIDTPPYDTVPYNAETFVSVAPGVKLEVLDWGGSGEVMVLLTGSGDNAHVFDYFAFQFTNFFHVIGITRRGWLPSSQPENGYDVETRAADDIKVLDALGIKKAIFVGHSLAGSELSEIAIKYPSYVDKLVYLDALDVSERFTTFPDVPYPFDLFTDADLKSIFTFQATYARFTGGREPIPATCLSYKFDKNGRVRGVSTPESINAQLAAGARAPAKPPTDWADIKEPRLGIFAPPTAESKAPWYWYLSPAKQAEFDERFPRLLQWYSNEISKFGEKHPGSPQPVVYLLPGAPHYVYINNEAEVVRQMRSFLGIPLAGN